MGLWNGMALAFAAMGLQKGTALAVPPESTTDAGFSP
jgi:hypothetical protein